MAGRIELNSAGIRALLRSEEVLADVEARAHRIAEAAGEGFVVESEVGTNRARAAVIAEGPDAIAAEATEHRLESSLDAGR